MYQKLCCSLDRRHSINGCCIHSSVLSESSSSSLSSSSLSLLSLSPFSLALCSKVIKYPDGSTGPRARPFAHSLAPLHYGLEQTTLDVSTGPLARPFARTAHSFACSGLLASLAPSAAALVCSLAHFAHSLTLLTPSLVGKWIFYVSK